MGKDVGTLLSIAQGPGRVWGVGSALFPWSPQGRIHWFSYVVTCGTVLEHRRIWRPWQLSGKALQGRKFRKVQVPGGV